MWQTSNQNRIFKTITNRAAPKMGNSMYARLEAFILNTTRKYHFFQQGIVRAQFHATRPTVQDVVDRMLCPETGKRALVSEDVTAEVRALDRWPHAIELDGKTVGALIGKQGGVLEIEYLDQHGDKRTRITDLTSDTQMTPFPLGMAPGPFFNPGVVAMEITIAGAKVNSEKSRNLVRVLRKFDIDWRLKSQPLLGSIMMTIVPLLVRDELFGYFANHVEGYEVAMIHNEEDAKRSCMFKVAVWVGMRNGDADPPVAEVRGIYNAPAVYEDDDAVLLPDDGDDSEDTRADNDYHYVCTKCDAAFAHWKGQPGDARLHIMGCMGNEYGRNAMYKDYRRTGPVSSK